LQIEQFLNLGFREDVMAAAHAFIETQSEQ
jgi:hypothetical protein